VNVRAVVDTSVLIYLINPNASAPQDEKSGQPVSHCKERLEGLLESLSANDVEVIVPTPVLSELLIKSGEAIGEILQIVRGKRAVRIEPFDMRAAAENALLRRNPKATARAGSAKSDVTFDCQIMAIARVHQAAMLYTDDAQFRTRCEALGIPTYGIADLPIPDTKRQVAMEYAPKAETEAPGPSAA
jgi:predicted nucleic acid-binding protein